MGFDFYSLLSGSNSGLLYAEEDIVPLLTLYLTRHSLKITCDPDGIYRDQVNELLLEPPLVRWSTTDSQVEMQMTYVYRTYSYYQSYPLDRRLLSTVYQEYTKEVTVIDPETGKPQRKDQKETRLVLQTPISYAGLGLDQPWFKSDYFVYNDMRVTLAGTYNFAKGTPDRRLQAFNQMLGDVNAIKDMTLIIGKEVDRLPSSVEFNKGWSEFWSAIAQYRDLFLDPPPEPGLG